MTRMGLPVLLIITYNSPEFFRKLSALKLKSYSFKNVTFYPSFGQDADL